MPKITIPKRTSLKVNFVSISAIVTNCCFLQAEWRLWGGGKKGATYSDLAELAGTRRVSPPGQRGRPRFSERDLLVAVDHLGVFVLGRLLSAQPKRTERKWALQRARILCQKKTPYLRLQLAWRYLQVDRGNVDPFGLLHPAEPTKEPVPPVSIQLLKACW